MHCRIPSGPIPPPSSAVSNSLHIHQQDSINIFLWLPKKEKEIASKFRPSKNQSHVHIWTMTGTTVNYFAVKMYNVKLPNQPTLNKKGRVSITWICNLVHSHICRSIFDLDNEKKRYYMFVMSKTPSVIIECFLYAFHNSLVLNQIQLEGAKEVQRRKKENSVLLPHQ